ncbi:MAG TPA: NAD-binding protein [Candidatus Limnocylindrales bacterium]|nr:NAD-binding protein [Candidatus Limnocylindrales bacterium]
MTNHRSNHFVISGSDTLAYRLASELSERYSADVVVIMTTHEVPQARDFSDLDGVEVLTVARIDEKALLEAGLERAAGFAITAQDDVGNIHVALLARDVAPDVRLVVRMYNSALGRSMASLISGCRALSDSEIAAPALVASALGEVAAAPVVVGQRTLVVTRRDEVPSGDIVCGLSVTQADGPLVLPEHEEAADLVLAEQRASTLEQTLRLGTAKPKRAPWFAIAGAFLAAAVSRKTRIALTIVFGVILLAGTLLSFSRGVGMWDGVYLTVVTVLGGLQSEASFAGGEKALQLLLGLAGLTFIPLVTALVVEGMVKARLAVEEARLRYPHSDHIVVIGLGGVGSRVLRLLHQRELKVVAIDPNENARGVSTARQLGIPLLIGDPSRESTLRMAGVERCRALMAIARSDVSNLETALQGRLLQQRLHVVLRLFDGDLASRVRRTFNLPLSRSVSFLAAPVFAEALMDREVIGTIAVERRLLLVADISVQAGSTLDGLSVGQVDDAGEVRVIAVTEFGEPRPLWRPPSGRLIKPRDRLTVVATRKGLGNLAGQSVAA